MRFSQLVLFTSLALIFTNVASHASARAKGIDIRPDLKTLNCNGGASQGDGQVEVKYEAGQPLTVTVTQVASSATTVTTYELSRAELVPAQIEIAGSAKGANQKEQGLLITIPITDLKARIWTVSDGLTKNHIQNAINKEGTTTCRIEQK